MPSPSRCPLLVRQLKKSHVIDFATMLVFYWCNHQFPSDSCFLGEDFILKQIEPTGNTVVSLLGWSQGDKSLTFHYEKGVGLHIQVPNITYGVLKHAWTFVLMYVDVPQPWRSAPVILKTDTQWKLNSNYTWLVFHSTVLYNLVLCYFGIVAWKLLNCSCDEQSRSNWPYA